MALMYFFICMKTITCNTYHVLYIGTKFGSNAHICTICGSEVLQLSHFVYGLYEVILCIYELNEQE